jgi:hypothetical protein
MSYTKAGVVNPAKTNRTGSAPSRKFSNRGAEEPHYVGQKAGGIGMDCPICKDLERAFEAKCGEYLEARYAAYYRVSTELAASKNVDMERAKSAFEEHRLVCGSAVKVSRLGPATLHYL